MGHSILTDTIYRVLASKFAVLRAPKMAKKKLRKRSGVMHDKHRLRGATWGTLGGQNHSDNMRGKAMEGEFKFAVFGRMCYFVQSTKISINAKIENWEMFHAAWGRKVIILYICRRYSTTTEVTTHQCCDV